MSGESNLAFLFGGLTMFLFALSELDLFEGKDVALCTLAVLGFYVAFVGLYGLFKVRGSRKLKAKLKKHLH